MRICILGKFPPIAGGVSHQTYLAAHELARRGHRVFVVTNADEVEPEFRQLLLAGDAERLEAHYSDGFVRCVQTDPVPVGSYLPRAQPYASKLFGLGLSVIEKHGCDLVVGWYLEPYGLVAAQLAATTGAPLVLRHAGSDLGRLAHHADLRRAYAWALRRADRVLTTPSSSDWSPNWGRIRAARYSSRARSRRPISGRMRTRWIWRTCNAARRAGGRPSGWAGPSANPPRLRRRRRRSGCTARSERPRDRSTC